MSFDPVFTFGTIAAAALIGLGVNHAIDGTLSRSRVPMALAELVTLAPGSFEHPRPGEFLKDNHPAPAPVAKEIIDKPLEIMKFQVTASDYDRCVSDGACKPADSRLAGNVPATGVSFLDAQAYANWLSAKTGETWRLPTDIEWAYVAAERFRADIEAGDGDPADPARRWLTLYRNESALGRKADPEPRPLGAFGANSKGVADVAGNVWEWTSTCYVHATMSGGAVASSVSNCGVHVVEGFHRTYMSNFIRDGKSGGCAVGTPPDNLGFRLVHDRSFLRAALRRLGLT
ncbi:formylglycine-generating enzyme family protein [Mesorhizobium hawassense]|uniref:Formylglycine-generating enzyme family protein n=1 Tax=Mesorhizobium hawassense TaxID=1209954 RepID=A0A330HQH1_9HYPH|nr:SUMF1/EgtB/PvdO family nonheme iron enzyme [Mesorhizobium hawassense]RAZ90971.1 formylglycine-generating enzyme family protein [Mesorhizobium hawassense]